MKLIYESFDSLWDVQQPSIANQRVATNQALRHPLGIEVILLLKLMGLSTGLRSLLTASVDIDTRGQP